MGIGIHAFPASNDGLASYLVYRISSNFGYQGYQKQGTNPLEEKVILPNTNLDVCSKRWQMVGILDIIHQLILLANLPEKSPCTFSMMGFSISTGFLKQPTIFSAWC